MRWDYKMSKEEITLYKVAVDNLKAIEVQTYALIRFCAEMKMSPERIKSMTEFLSSMQNVLGSIEGDIRRAEGKD
jgi:uncharacterized protein (AIM24 family)